MKTEQFGNTCYQINEAESVEFCLQKEKKVPLPRFKIQEGAVNGIVTIDIGGGNVISSTISMNTIKELGLEVGKEAYAVIKATSVRVGVDE